VLATVNYPPTDPRSVVVPIARRLAIEFDRAPTAMISRELRQALDVLVDHPNEPAGKIDEITAQRLARRVDQMTAAVGFPSGRRSGGGFG
jgi:hypothetical protein